MNRYYYISFIFLFVMCLGCEKEQTFSIDDSFEFKLEDTSGITISKDAVIKLSVKKLVETKQGFTVEFKSDKGTLAAQTIPFEGEYATTYLRLDENESIYYLTAKIKDKDSKLLTEKSIIYTPATFKDEFDFLISDTAGVLADGHSEVRLLVTGIKENYANTTVTFTPTKGNVLLNEVAFEGNTARSYFKVPRTAGNTYITAVIKVNNETVATKALVYNLSPALPSSISIAGDKATYNLSSSITLQTVLFDHNETTNISEGLRVTYSAFQLSASNTKVDVGNFVNALDTRTDTEGKVPNVTFMTDARVDTNKVIFIEASTQGKLNAITKTIDFEYSSE